jgi:DNA-binding transcriptional MerR regulator
MPERIKVFSSGQAQVLAGISHRQMNYWVDNALFTPSINPGKRGPLGKGERRQWAFQDIVALRVASDLRHAGVPLQFLRRIATFVAKYPQPFDKKYLVVRGDEVGVADGGELLSVLSQPKSFLAITVYDVATVENEIAEAVKGMQQAA